jgi:hypothetical protein
MQEKYLGRYLGCTSDCRFLLRKFLRKIREAKRPKNPSAKTAKKYMRQNGEKSGRFSPVYGASTIIGQGAKTGMSERSIERAAALPSVIGGPGAGFRLKETHEATITSFPPLTGGASPAAARKSSVAVVRARAPAAARSYRRSPARF